MERPDSSTLFDSGRGGHLSSWLRREWILKALVESVLVVASILLALAVDEWSEERENAELADQSLGIFEQEILRNRARIEDVAPFHQGIRDVVDQMRTRRLTVAELRGVTDGVEAPVLLNTAWETALATGALTHMEVSVVSALSLTYSIQDRFMAQLRTERPPRLVGGSALSEADLRERAQEVFEYLRTLTSGESELLAVYEEALEVIRTHRTASLEDSTAEGAADAREPDRP